MNALNLNGIKIAYEDRGAGQPVVLLHGYPLNHQMWQPQIEALSGFCRVIAPDLRGFGESTLADGDAKWGVTMAQYADDVARLLDAIGVDGPVILCGFSMGGYIMWQFIATYPDRVKAFVPCDTRAIADSEEARQGRLKTADEVADQGVETVIEAMLPKLLTEETRKSRPEVVAQTTAVMRSCSPEAVAAAQRGMAGRPDVTEQLVHFAQPALVLVGAEDAISSPEEMRGIAQQLPHAKFVEIPRAGHMSTLENPDAVNDALSRFVRSLAAE